MAKQCDQEEISGIRTTCPDVDHATPTHIPGVRTGNRLGSYTHSPGHLLNGRSTARRSTGINAKKRNPILPEMPNLSPP